MEEPLKIAISATNPCHLWPLAKELEARHCLDTYFSGYPAWKLTGANVIPRKRLVTRSWRTLITYGFLRIPEKYRFKNRTLFRWQDSGFDAAVARAIASRPHDQPHFIHALPGQALKTFQQAKKRGIRTVLNHATGPVDHLKSILAPEFQKRGLDFNQETAFDSHYFQRETLEYQLADYHFAASSIVKEQLIQKGIPESKIKFSTYGSEDHHFYPPTSTDDHPPSPFRILFAGMLSLRKGIQTLLNAVQLAARPDWSIDFYGQFLEETQQDFQSYHGLSPIKRHGSVTQQDLGKIFRDSTAGILVLPSLEEGFGLVVSQALACGLPCLVSDRVGAKDLILPGLNGDIFPVQNEESLASLLLKWSQQKRDRQKISQTCPQWGNHAQETISLHAQWLEENASNEGCILC